MARARGITLYGAAAFPQRARNGFSCPEDPAGGLTFTWTAEPRAATTTGGAVSEAPLSAAADRLLGVASLSPDLVLPPKALPGRSSWTFTLRACYGASRSESLCGTASRSVTAASSPIVPVLSGGYSVVTTAMGAILFDASASYDPDDEPGTLRFAWACEAPVSQLLGTPDRACLGPDREPITRGLGPGGGPQLSIALLGGAGGAAGTNYTISVTVSKGGARSARSEVWLGVRSDSPAVLPRISVRVVTPARGGKGTRVSPSDKILLAADIVSTDPPSLTTLWSVASSPPALSARTLAAGGAATPLNSSSLVLNPNVLPPDSVVVLRLTATDSQGSSFTDVPLSVSAEPRGGSVAISPPEGLGLTTRFTLNATGWERQSADLPLEYSFLYSVLAGAGAAGAEGGGFTTLSPFSPSPVLVALLPAGAASGSYRLNVTVQARHPARRAAMRVVTTAPQSCLPCLVCAEILSVLLRAL